MKIIAAQDPGGPSAAATSTRQPVGSKRTAERTDSPPRRGATFSLGGSRSERPVRLSDAELALLFSNTATLLNSGIPLIKALEALATDESLARASGILKELIEDIRSGDSFSGALSKQSGVFAPLVVSLIKSGETTGQLTTVLERLTDDLELRRGTITQIRQALTYPTIVTVLGSGAVGFLMVFVVPVFEETYGKAGIPLPSITQALIGVSKIVSATWWIALLLALGGAMSYWQFRDHPAVQSKRDALFLRLPLIGAVFQSVLVGRFVRTLGGLLDGGISLKDSLGLTEHAVKHYQYVEMTRELRLAVNRGEGIGAKLSEYRTLMPPLMIRMIALGEQSGDLGHMLMQVEKFAQKDLRLRVQRMTGMIEPIITIVMAVVIGTIALAIYLPIFDMYQQIQK